VYGVIDDLAQDIELALKVGVICYGIALADEDLAM